MGNVRLDGHFGPWSEHEFLALDEISDKIELVDWSLWVSPGANGPHQDICGQLRDTLRLAARRQNLRARLDMNVRLAPGTIVRPDIVVASTPRLVSVIEAAEVLLVGEVTSPSNARTDRELKRRLYATAQIGWYLLAEPDMPAYESVTLRLLRLEGADYVEHAVAKAGETLTLSEPVTASISTDDLLDL